MRSRSSVILAVLFVTLTLTVMTGMTESFDHAAVDVARALGTIPWLNFTMQMITESGDVWYMLGFGILLILLRRTRRIGITLMILLVVSTLLAGYIKCGVDRERPQEPSDSLLPVAVSRDTFALFCQGGFDASYPSGHALRTTIIAILFAYALYTRFPRGAHLLFLYPALVAISRVMVLQHYPSDVIGGIILGILLTGILGYQTKLYRVYKLQT